ncbi:MAG: hypothetical protein RR517_25145 [Pseudomonas sp.]
MDDFTDFLDKLKNDAAYQTCILGVVGGPMAIAAMASGGPLTIVIVGAAGLYFGVEECHQLSPMIRQKLMSNARLSDGEVVATLRAIQIMTGVQDPSDAMYLLSNVRQAVASGMMESADRKSCLPPPVAASMILSQRG